MAYYYKNLMMPHVEASKADYFLEIGGGSGNLTSILQNEFNPKVFFLIDLPESITNAVVFLNDLFPDARKILPNNAENFIKSKFDKGGNSKVSFHENDVPTFCFLTPWQVELLLDNFIDLPINTESSQEMTHAQINEYFNLVARVSKNRGLFFV